MLMAKDWISRRARFAAALVAALTVAACQDRGASPVGPEASAAFAKGTPGGGKTDAPGQGKKNSLPIAVAISPTTKEVETGDFAFFFATVTNSTDLRVSWSATCGTFSSASSLSGEAHQWTAPGTVGTCTVTATSVADPTKSASATVTVVVPAPPEPLAFVEFVNGDGVQYEFQADFLAFVQETSLTVLWQVYDCSSEPAVATYRPDFPRSMEICADPTKYVTASWNASYNIMVGMDPDLTPIVGITAENGTCDTPYLDEASGKRWVTCRINAGQGVAMRLSATPVTP